MRALNSSARGITSLELFEEKSGFFLSRGCNFYPPLLTRSVHRASHASMSVSHPGDMEVDDRGTR
jgi:hypothetical protein